MLTLQEQIQNAAQLIRQAGMLVALTGAGISTESGIPDFRSPGAIWERHPPISYQDFLGKPEARRAYWQLRRALIPQVVNAQPNAAHKALVDLERREVLQGVITQNFDGLHQDAGQTPERVIELHGTSRSAACTLCGARSSMSKLQQRIDSGEIDPCCQLCGGFLKAATILFGQQVPENELDRARELAENCDLFLVIGSSLTVRPAAHLPRFALKRRVPLIIINIQPTALDEEADIVIHEKAGDILPAIVKLI